MQSFTDFVANNKPRQNLHLTHLDEALFESGTKAYNETVDVLQSLIENDDRYQITQKFDGAPAIFCGTDPSDGQFFVGTKSVFNKSPKLYKTYEQIVTNEKPGLAKKLCEALKWLPFLKIPEDTVLQGDLLWTEGDHVYETYEGQRYVTVHPNTLVYAWLAESEEGKAVRNAKLGIVFHTTYRGRNNLSNYSATFGANTDKLTSIPEVWYDNAYFKDKNIKLDPEVKQSILESIGSTSAGCYDGLPKLMETLPSSAVGANVKTFYNSFIREGLYPRPDQAFEQSVDYIKSYWDKTFISKLKTEEGVSRRKAQLAQLITDVRAHQDLFEASFDFVSTVAEAKSVLIEALDAQNDQKVFIRTDAGLQEAEAEGYVVINKTTGDAYKLVDREKFSYYNFSDSVKKGWQK